MPHELDISALFLRQWEKYGDQLNALNGSTFLLADAMDSEFMQACSELNSFQALLDASGYKVNDQADFERIPAEAWDKHIASHTSYPDWGTMLDAATAAYVMRQLEQNT